jgi:hypothetical protein
MDRPESDHPFFACINLERGEGVHIDQGWFGSCRTGNGVNIQATHRGEVVLGASRIMGHWQSGVFLAAGPVDVHIGAGCEIGDNSVQGANLFSGITIDAGASRFNFSHFRSGNLVGVLGNFQGYGLVIGDNCADYTIDDFNLDGNGLGPMLVGTGQVRGYIGDGTPFPRSQWLHVTVNAGNTTGSTPHGMGATPQIVGSLTARNDSGNTPRLWTTADATKVTVNASAALTNTTVFDVLVRRTS